MKAITIQGKEYLLVEVPEFTHEHLLASGNDLVYWSNQSHSYESEKFGMHGNYEIIGKASDLTETQWHDILQVVKYKDWVCGYPSFTKEMLIYPYAKNSGLSLLSSHNLQPQTTLIIRKK